MCNRHNQKKGPIMMALQHGVSRPLVDLQIIQTTVCTIEEDLNDVICLMMLFPLWYTHDNGSVLFLTAYSLVFVDGRMDVP